MILVTGISAVVGLLSSEGIRQLALSAIVSVDVLVLAMHYYSQKIYEPKLEFSVSGEHNGSPIPVPSKKDSVWLGVTTEQDREISLEEIRIEYNDSLVNISINEDLVKEGMRAQTEKGTVKVTIKEYEENENEPSRSPIGKIIQGSSFDRQNPESIIISNIPKVRKGYIMVYGLDFKTDSDDFSIMIKGISRIEDYEIKFPWNMFNFGSKLYTKIYHFRVDDQIIDPNKKTLRYGFTLPPGKTMTIGEVIH